MISQAASWFRQLRKPRAASAPQPARGTDSRPAGFHEIPIEELFKRQSKWLSFFNPLESFTVEEVRRSVNDYLQGAYAREQWLWDQMEMYDGLLSICVDKREKALKKFDAQITLKKGLSDRDAMLAESQARTAQDILNSIANFQEATQALGQASRRHYKFLQPYYEANALYYLPIDNWLICRDGYNGDWGWNPSASFGQSHGEAFPIPLTDLVVRISARPLDMPAQMLVLARTSTKAQWDVHLGRYGTPPQYIEMPPDVNEEMERAYQAAAMAMLSDAVGTMPNGAKLHTATVPTTSVEMFGKRIEMNDQELCLIMTGSYLPMMATPGTGTLAGGAAQDSSDDIELGEAEEIGSVWTHEVNKWIEQYHPGQPCLVECTMAKQQKADPEKESHRIVELASQGYRTEDSQVTEITGLEVTSANMDSTAIYAAKAAGYIPEMEAIQERMGMPMKPAPVEVLDPVAARKEGAAAQAHGRLPSPYEIITHQRGLREFLAENRSRTLYEPARKVLESRVTHRLENLDNLLERVTRASLPLTDAEKNQIKAALSVPTAQDLQELAEALQKPLFRAVKQKPTIETK